MAESKLPQFRKRFSDFLPLPRRLLSATKAFFLRAAVTGAGTVAMAQGFLPNVDRPGPIPLVIVNRERKSSVGKLVLRLGNAYGHAMFAGHRSHSSHSSHRSHSSHSSHYSSSRGSGASPSPAPPPYVPPPPSTPSEPSKPKAPATGLYSSRPSPDVVNSVEILEAVVIEITRVDFEQSLLIGRDRRKVELAFLFTPESKIRQISPQESIRMVRDFTKESLPFVSEQEVLVTWKRDSKGQRLAVMITTY
jgi:hypothetical protein